MMLTSFGLNFIKKYEGFKSTPYLDSGGIATIGYGTTYYLDGRKVTLTDAPIEEFEARMLLLNTLNIHYCPQIEKLLKIDISANAFTACVSLAYNIGLRNFKYSTVLRCINANQLKDAAKAFLLWDKANSVILPGLITRRTAEMTLFSSM